MADSVRMIDLAGLTRGLDAFRHLDPEQWVLAHRLATQAAVKRVEKTPKDVGGSDRSGESRLRPPEPEQRPSGRQRHGPEGCAPSDTEPEAVPERDGGNLLDIKV